MTAHEGGDEDLIFLVQTGELGQLEAAFDCDVFFGEADTLTRSITMGWPWVRCVSSASPMVACIRPA
jgi:hypothetical protein